LFFDKGNIEKAIKSDLKESEFNKNKVKFTPVVAGVPKETCPRCDGKLKLKTDSKDSVTANIYYCKECGGIWLEHGEYDNVKKIFDLQKAEFTKDGRSIRKARDDDWLFYPYIYYPYITGGHVSSSSGSSSSGSSYSGGHHGGGGSSSCVASSCACVSCACVSCVCACACAGGGAAGCSPKDKFNQIHLYDNVEKGK
jgi:Zn-finger nucleic acid-binding protein